MIHSIDERRGIEEQIVRSLYLEIGRCTYQQGELLPAPELLASNLLVSPRRVSVAYRRLCSEQIVTLVKGQGYRLQADAAACARTRLLEAFRVDLMAAIIELRLAGCSSVQIEAAMNDAKTENYD